MASKWEQLAEALLDPTLPGWQRLGYLGPDGKRLVDNIRRRTKLGEEWYLSLRGDIIYCKRKESLLEQRDQGQLQEQGQAPELQVRGRGEEEDAPPAGGGSPSDV